MLVVGYALMIGGLVFAILAVDRSAVYRVTAITEQFSITTIRELYFGRAPVQITTAPKIGCRRAALVIPAGAEIRGGKRAGTGETYLSINGVSGAPIEAACEDGLLIKAANVTMNGPEAIKGRDGRLIEQDALAERKAVFRIGGQVILGGLVDNDTPSDGVAILRSARITSEVAEWPNESMIVLSERVIDAGNRISFRRNSAAQEATAEGILVMKPQIFELWLRVAGHSVVVTSPGATRGAEVVIAPGFFDRVKARAEWGIWAIVASLLLGFIEVLRSFDAAPNSARKLKPPLP